MKKLMIFITLIMPVTLLAQKAEVIESVMADYSTIESEINNNNYTKNSVEYSAYEHNQYGSVTEYRLTKRPELKKTILSTLFYDENLYEVTFYTKNDKLFFAYFVTTVPNYSTGRQVIHISENRFYFYEGRLIKYLIKNYKESQKSSSVANKQINHTISDQTQILKKFEAAQEILKDPKTEKRIIY